LKPFAFFAITRAKMAAVVKHTVNMVTIHTFPLWLSAVSVVYLVPADDIFLEPEDLWMWSSYDGTSFLAEQLQQRLATFTAA
jgi:hypothetical protein